MSRIADRLHTHRVSQLFAAHGVALAYLYGSQARGESGPLSDVDIAVLFTGNLSKQARFQHVLALCYELGVVLQRDDVQVVDLQEASPLLRHRIYYDGHLLYCPDDVVRVRFEIASEAPGSWATLDSVCQVFRMASRDSWLLLLFCESDAAPACCPAMDPVQVCNMVAQKPVAV